MAVRADHPPGERAPTHDGELLHGSDDVLFAEPFGVEAAEVLGAAEKGCERVVRLKRQGRFGGPVVGPLEGLFRGPEGRTEVRREDLEDIAAGGCPVSRRNSKAAGRRMHAPIRVLVCTCERVQVGYRAEVSRCRGQPVGTSGRTCPGPVKVGHDTNLSRSSSRPVYGL